MTTYASDDLKRILALHVKYLVGEAGGKRADLSTADLSYADLSYANLSSANLSSANLRSANLSTADLSSADLSSADLRSADLSTADLSTADLSYANLSYANLRSANLSYADLRSANLSYANLSDGVRWGEYLADVVPALLVAGGQPLEVVATPEHWACHSWNGESVGCPMAVAFGARNLSDIPALHRWQAARFIQLFDAGLIPLPTIPAKV